MSSDDAQLNAPPLTIDPLEAARDWLAKGQPVALATVIETWGAAAVPVGGQLAIVDQDHFQGSVSGGCVEADVIAAAADVLASGQPVTLSFGVSNALAWTAGLACGGQIRVHLCALNPAGDLERLERISLARASRQMVIVETHLATGAARLHTISSDATSGVQDAFGARTSRVIQDAKAGEVFLHAIVPPPRIIIVGATHIAQALTRLAAVIGYDTVVVDPRTAFASTARFGVTGLDTAWPESALPKWLEDPFSAVVTLTHADAIDDEALAIALRTPCRYIGALGARRTHAARLVRLKEAGFSDADLRRIHAPVGLDIGARSAGEIAVSIMAEIVAAFRKPPSGPAS